MANQHISGNLQVDGDILNNKVDYQLDQSISVILNKIIRAK